MTGDPDWVAPVVPLFGGSRAGAEESAPPGLARGRHPAGSGLRSSGRTSARGSDPESGIAEGEPRGRDPEKLAERQAKRARNVGVSALTRRGLSVAELRDTLEKRGIDADQIEAELERLQESSYLDDARLAEAVVRTETERKGKGRGAIAAELRRRRVDAEAIESALETLDEDDERARAIDVAQRRARQLGSLPPDVARRRLAAFLQRRGFGGSTLQDALSAALPRSGGPSASGVRFDTDLDPDDD
ncbi:MAG TPA: RecX family transcriptional regulator [Naasia sp.]